MRIINAEYPATLRDSVGRSVSVVLQLWARCDTMSMRREVRAKGIKVKPLLGGGRENSDVQLELEAAVFIEEHWNKIWELLEHKEQTDNLLNGGKDNA